MQKRLAFAVDAEGKIASTLGTAEFFLLKNPEGRVSAKGMIPQILPDNGVQVLFCGGIGMCLLSLVEAENIEVHPGCAGSPETILADWLAGTLPEGENFLCSDHGRTCGSCPGRF